MTQSIEHILGFGTPALELDAKPKGGELVNDSTNVISCQPKLVAKSSNDIILNEEIIIKPTPIELILMMHDFD